ncbi:MAG TPA: hypothetical protein VIV58_16775 [Kofleriaceae bacterium]
MTPDRIDPDVRRLLETELDSFEKLELLARIRGAASGLDLGDPVFDNDAMRWTLDELLKASFIEKRGRLYVLGPRGAQASVVALLSLYAADRMTVVAELSTLSLERIRSMASRAFANAFVLRKKRGDGDG